MTAVVKVAVLPQGHPPVQLSSMTMVHTDSPVVLTIWIFGFEILCQSHH